MADDKRVSTKEVFTKEDIEKNKVIAMVAYLLFFLPLITDKDSKFGKFHANQGLNLLLTSILGGIVFSIILPSISWIWTLAVMAFMVIGAKGAYEGKADELPLIGKYRLLK